MPPKTPTPVPARPLVLMPAGVTMVGDPVLEALTFGIAEPAAGGPGIDGRLAAGPVALATSKVKLVSVVPFLIVT